MKDKSEKEKLEVYKDMLDQIGAGASAGGSVAQEAFTQFFCDFLVGQQYMSDYTPAYFNARWNSGYVRIDAYYYDEQTHDLTLVVSDFSNASVPEQIGVPEMRKNFDHVQRFFRACTAEGFVKGIEDSEEVTPLVHLIRDNINLITRVRYILITNKTLGNRVNDNVFDELKRKASIDSEFTAWDFLRYFEMTVEPSPEIEIDCRPDTECGKGLPFLTSASAGFVQGSTTEREYSAYLVMVPGRCICNWYAQYADRLLEQNVRTFLQFKGKINRGIRNTLNSEPNRFLAYNNGLTATAESVEMDSNGKHIVGIKNLQIVNGGQTTASIYSAYTASGNEEMLDAVSVQMKLIVTTGSHVEDLVGKISRYANSQNKIKDTDFVSNHPFMKRLEGFSRRKTANPGGTTRGTRWFFERTRGQYLNTINLFRKESDRTAFKKLYPKDQVLTKSDMAKYLLSWDWAPWIVAKGAEKAFVELTDRKFGSDPKSGDGCVPGRERIEPWEKKGGGGNPQFNEHFYVELIGKAILYRQLDKALRGCEWCKGYKSQVLTYTISMFRYLLYVEKKTFDFMPIWKEQKIPIMLLDYLVEIAYDVYTVLNETADGRNVSEWAKRPEFWIVLKGRLRNKGFPRNLLDASFVVSVGFLETVRKSSAERQVEDNDKKLLELVREVEDSIWAELRLWLESHQLPISKGQAGALGTVCHSKNWLDVALAKKLILLWKQASNEGFPHPPMDDLI